MAIEITPYTRDLVGAVREFNVRLKAGGESYRFPERHSSKLLPKRNQCPFQEYFLALENKTAVRGAYVLQHQEFSFRGEIREIGFYTYPVSEGLVNKSYRPVGAQLLMSALKRQPLLFGMGIGSLEEPQARMLGAAKWSLTFVPFYFRVNHPNRFLRNIRPLRATRRRAFLADTLASTGLGWLAIKSFQAARKRAVLPPVSVEVVERFGTWTDKVWEVCRSKYAMVAVRDSASLNTLYPPNDLRFARIRVCSGDETYGWAVLLDTQMSNNKYFGDMRVGSIIDCLSLPEHADKVVSAATTFLESRGCDLILSNQSHSSWCLALKRTGFIEGPSNCIFAASRSLANLIHPFESGVAESHLNRGDGDGPIHL